MQDEAQVEGGSGGVGHGERRGGGGGGRGVWHQYQVCGGDGVRGGEAVDVPDLGLGTAVAGVGPHRPQKRPGLGVEHHDRLLRNSI